MNNKFYLRSEEGNVHEVLYDQTKIVELKKQELKKQKEISDIVYTGYSDDSLFGVIFGEDVKLDDYKLNYERINFRRHISDLYGETVNSWLIPLKNMDFNDKVLRENKEISQYFDDKKEEIAFRFKDNGIYEYYLIRSKIFHSYDYLHCDQYSADTILRVTENLFVLEKFKKELLPLILESELDYSFLNQVCNLESPVARSTSVGEFYNHFLNKNDYIRECDGYLNKKIESMPSFVKVLSK